jgi:hypothetical protein
VVTLALLAAGAAFGALAGVVTLAIAALVNGEFRALADIGAFGLAAYLGAILGAPLFPIVGWLLLRRVPLGHAVLGSVVGTVLGGIIGWMTRAGGDEVNGAVFVGAAGFLLAALCLRAWDSVAPRRSDGTAA